MPRHPDPRIQSAALRTATASAAIHPARSRHGLDAAAATAVADVLSAAIHASSSCRSWAECQRASGSFSRHFVDDVIERCGRERLHGSTPAAARP